VTSPCQHRHRRFKAPRCIHRLLAAIIALSFGAEAMAQVFVYPRRPHKSQVRYFEFEWRHIDILVGPEAGPETREEGPRSPFEHVRHMPGLDDGTPPAGVSLPAHGHAHHHGPSTGAWQGLGATGPSGGGLAGPALRLRSRLFGAQSEEAEIQRGVLGQDDVTGGDGGPIGGDEGVAPHGPPGQTDPAPPPIVEVDPDEVPVTPLPPHTGGVRLYFYEEAREIAERAAAIIDSQYRYLIDQFDYVPTRTFPYVLYSSYQEFLQTNLFPLQEGVLGVTSPRDLTLSLPYFGDHRLFQEVSLHEMVHQFTIQKVRTYAERAGVWGDPLEAMPLWFIEGIAEFYAKRGLDHETEMLVRDIVVNPDFARGYLMLDFHDDRPWSALWTYKVGQARAAFLEETYGDGTLQTILEQTPLLVGAVGDEPQTRGFPALLQRITGDAPAVMSRKFEDWIKRRAFETYLSAEQAAPQVEPVADIRGRANALAASPDGNLLMYRSLDFETGRTRLFLLDRRDPRSQQMLVGDSQPGVESLHPIQVRNFDLADDRLVYIAQAGGKDLIYVQPIERTARRLDAPEPAAPTVPPPVIPAQPGEPAPVPPGDVEESEDLPGVDPDEAWDVRLRTGRRIGYDVSEHGIIAAFSPALSPDGERVAFVGLEERGVKNVFVLEPQGENGAFSVRRLTDDDFAQRQVSWGPEGVIYSSDATEHGRYNLFLANPEGAATTRLTTESRDHFDPRALPDGRVMFTAYTDGRADLHEVVDGEILRRTDIETGLFDVAPGPNDGVWALFHRGGQRRPALVTRPQLMAVSATPQGPPGTARLLPEMALLDDEAYRAFSLANWELGNLFGFFGAGAGGVFGQLLATGSDRLRDHVLILNLFVFGSLELTDGYLLYINQQRRVTWGAGPFQSLRFRVDQTFDNLPRDFTSGERFFGGMFSARYPFHRFSYIQGDLMVGGVDYFLSPDARDFLRNPERNLAGRDLLEPWEEATGGLRFQTEASARVGYDTIRYHPGTGPLAGSSAMLEGTVAFQPFDDEVFGNLRLDAERYFPIWGRTHLFLRGGAGASFGGRLARQFFLSSFDTIRGVEFGDPEWLLGRHFYFTTAELQFPLNALIRLILFTDIEGVLGVDFGGVADELDELLDRRVLNLVTGLNFGFGPLVFRLHFARPVDTGAPFGLPTGESSRWVTNFSLGWLYF
jgi:hypothetical protein